MTAPDPADDFTIEMHRAEAGWIYYIPSLELAGAHADRDEAIRLAAKAYREAVEGA